MTKILVVNPNTTASMTEKVAVAARQAAAPATEILATNSAYGPVPIEGYVDEVYAIPGMLEEMRTRWAGMPWSHHCMFRRHGPRCGAMHHDGASRRYRRGRLSLRHFIGTERVSRPSTVSRRASLITI